MNINYDAVFHKVAPR